MREPEMKRLPPKLVPMLTAIIFMVLLFIGWQIISRNQYLPVNPDDRSRIELRIPANSTATQVAHILKENDLIRSERAFLNFCREQKLDVQLKAGVYSLSRAQNLYDIARQLAAGETVQNKFTVPEGYTLEKIGTLLVNHKIISRAEWQDALQDKYKYDFLPGQANLACLEGFLFPDTYEITEDITAHEIIDNMLKNFANHWDNEFAELARVRGTETRDVIIVASLVEKEAQVSEERKRIAGVIYNRLAIGMPLQIDATVLYSLGEHKEQISYQDLQVNSPYNTYLHPGLPIGPIANPGTESIKAALSPEKHSYYYYVARGDGSHYFSKTYAEHQNAIKKYQ